MSHQINFYITPSDLADIEKKIIESGELVILHSYSPTSTPRVVDTMVCKPNEPQWLFYYLVRKSDLDKVITNYIEKQNYWSVDSLRSPVIEFNSCYLSKNTIRRGRVYYANKFYDNAGTLICKSDDFCKWAKRIFSILKNCVTKHDKDYIGSDAIEWKAVTKDAQFLPM